VVGVPAYFLGKQGSRDAMFPPEAIKSRIRIAIPDFKWESLKDIFHNFIFGLTEDIFDVLLIQQS